MKELKLSELKKQKDNLLIVHYSCSSIDDKFPEISSISTFDTSSNSLTLFSRKNTSKEDEIELLSNFFVYLSEKIQKKFYVVGWYWGERFGINVLIKRYQQLTKKEPDAILSKIKSVDFLEVLKKEYEYFVGTLKLLAQYNEFPLDNFIDGKIEIDLLKKKEFQKLSLSSSAKIEVLHNVIQKSFDGSLKVPDLEEIYYSFAGLGSYPAFRVNLQKINDFLDEKKVKIYDKSVQTFSYNLLFINLVTIMEIYLSDTLISAVSGDRNLLKKYFDYNSKDDSKIRKKELYKELFSEINKSNLNLEQYLRKKFIQEMKTVTFHNIDPVCKLYKNVLDIDFPKNKEEIIAGVKIRHDLVHRNGKNKDDDETTITLPKLKKMMDEVEKFVKVIHEQSKKLIKKQF